MKKSALLLAIALVIIAGTSSAKDWPKIRVATEGAFKPWNYTDTDGQLKGFEIDLTHELCKRMNAECTIEKQAWKGIIPALNAKKFDAIIAGMNKTEERLKAIAFSRSYAVAVRKFYVNESSSAALDTGVDFIDLDEIGAKEQAALDRLNAVLKGKVVGVQVQTVLETFLRKYVKGVDIRTYDTQENLDLDVEAGRVDMGLASISYVLPSIKDGKKFKVIGPGLNGGVYGSGQSVGIRKEDQDLADQFSRAIESAIKDGTIKALSAKWFGFDLTPPK